MRRDIQAILCWQGTRAATGDNTPPICGLNTGQHIYLDAGEFSSDQAKISLSLSGSTERKWNILVRQFQISDSHSKDTFIG